MSQRGFTLIEVLVAGSLLALLLVVLLGGLRFGVRAWDGAQAHGSRTDTLRVVQDLLRREIESAAPGLDGSAAAMSFDAPGPQAVGAQGRVRIVLAAEQGARAFQLTIRAGTSSPQPLLDHLAGLRFAYFADGRWRDDWHGHASLPGLVRLRVTFADGDRRAWPDLIVAPRIDAGAGCVYDLAAHRCAGGS